MHKPFFALIFSNLICKLSKTVWVQLYIYMYIIFLILKYSRLQRDSKTLQKIKYPIKQKCWQEITNCNLIDPKNVWNKSTFIVQG